MRVSDNESDLIALIATGDQVAFQTLYAAYAPRLWHYVWHQLDGNAPWTEEIVQDIFLLIWRSAGGFRREAKVGTWIFQIAHNVVSNARRNRGRQAEGRLMMVPNYSNIAGDDREPASVSFEEATVNRLLLAEALDTLSVKQQAVIDLIFLQGFTLEEVAQILAVPLGTVKSRVIGARRALRKHLGTIRIGQEGAVQDGN
jgi:RNA polymerase sigma-70 factor, ECF subfamily